MQSYSFINDSYATKYRIINYTSSSFSRPYLFVLVSYYAYYFEYAFRSTFVYTSECFKISATISKSDFNIICQK